jgi:hypothetical protein
MPLLPRELQGQQHLSKTMTLEQDHDTMSERHSVDTNHHQRLNTSFHVVVTANLVSIAFFYSLFIRRLPWPLWLNRHPFSPRPSVTHSTPKNTYNMCNMHVSYQLNTKILRQNPIHNFTRTDRAICLCRKFLKRLRNF